MANFVYLSPEWAEEGRRRAEAELTPEKLHNVTSSMTNIYKNCPDGKEHYFYVAVQGRQDSRLSRPGKARAPRRSSRSSPTTIRSPR